MGNYRFKLSELIPNAWFHKLKDMSKSRKHHKQPYNTTASPSLKKKHHAVPTSTTTTARCPRPSIRSSHNTYWPPNTPTKPPRNRHRHRVTVDSKSSTTSGDSAATGTGSFSPDFRSDQLLLPDEVFTTTFSHTSPCVFKLSKSATFTPPLELDLRPIITKPATTSRKTAVSSPTGVRVRLRSPRISTRKSVSSGGRRSGSSTRRSRAVMKASVDPRRDFKESMEEMIAENDIRTSKDLEELLACYLCLNSEEYHTIIIKVFKKIWLDLNLPLSHSK